MVLDALRRTELRGCKQGSRHAQKALRIIRVSMSSPFLCLMYFAIMDMCDPAPVYALERVRHEGCIRVREILHFHWQALRLSV